MLLKDIVMISNSLPEYYFICVCIVFLHHIAPVSIFLCSLTVLLRITGISNPLPFSLQLWTLAESLFYFLIYVPLKIYYQRAADHPPLPSRTERQELFNRCHETVNDPERYLTMWFKDAPRSEIKRDNLKEFFAWGFLDSGTWSAEEDEELEGYVSQMQSILGRKIPPGRGSATSLRLTLDKFEPLHRSLLWYGCVCVVDTIAFTRLTLGGFHFHRLPLSRSLTVFPFRPLAPFSSQLSPSNTLTYWHRAHKSKTKLPLVFIHGIGIGLYPYTKFLNELNHATEATTMDGDVGIIVIEVMAISFRITSKPLASQEFCRDMHLILQKHGWNKFVLASHSYGSVISTQMLHDPQLSTMIGPVMLIDPVCFLLHQPDVAYNFTVRKPKDANELQLWYFGSKDISVAWTLARHFFWAELILWREDLRNHKVTVSLGGRDLIVDTKTVGKYLSEDGRTTKHITENDRGMEWQKTGFTGGDINVLWFEQLDHAQVFDKQSTRKALLDILRMYCSSDCLSSVDEKVPNGSLNGKTTNGHK